MPYDSDKKSFSSESLAFRRLAKKDKYKKLLDFCKVHNQTPRTYKRPEEERVLGQFLVNSKALAKKETGVIENWELPYLKELSKYEVYQKDPISRLNEILKWSIANEKTPSQSSTDTHEKKLGQALNSLKLSQKRDKLNEESEVLLNDILEYKTNHQRTRPDKLGDILEFCRRENRTPKQHVKNKSEKRLAEFISTTKGLLKQPDFVMDEKSQILFDEILTFAPPTRESRLTDLLKFANECRRKPLTSSDDAHEAKLAAFLSKMKSALKRGQLSIYEATKVSNILSLCQIKTREEKLDELYEWISKNDTYPVFVSDDDNEKRLAMFMNNIKQIQKKRPKSLNGTERSKINSIFKYSSRKQRV